MGVLSEFEVPCELLAVIVTDWIKLTGEVLLEELCVKLNGIEIENWPPKGCEVALAYQFVAAANTSTGTLALAALTPDVVVN